MAIEVRDSCAPGAYFTIRPATLACVLVYHTTWVLVWWGSGTWVMGEKLGGLDTSTF